MSRTSLNVKFAVDCLQNNEWNMDKAYANFEQVKVSFRRKDQLYSILITHSLLGDVGERSISLRCLPNGGHRPSRHTPCTHHVVFFAYAHHTHRSHDFGLYCICLLRCSSLVFLIFQGVSLSNVAQYLVYMSNIPTNSSFSQALSYLFAIAHTLLSHRIHTSTTRHCSIIIATMISRCLAA